MTSSKSSRFLAFIRKSTQEKGPEGPILHVEEGPFLHEVEASGWDLSDHSFQQGKVFNQPFQGLVLFEGWVEYYSGPDPDVTFVGSWRKLTHWEMCRVREGLTPWPTASMAEQLEIYR